MNELNVVEHIGIGTDVLRSKERAAADPGSIQRGGGIERGAFISGDRSFIGR